MAAVRGRRCRGRRRGGVHRVGHCVPGRSDESRPFRYAWRCGESLCFSEWQAIIVGIDGAHFHLHDRSDDAINGALPGANHSSPPSASRNIDAGGASKVSRSYALDTTTIQNRRSCGLGNRRLAAIA